MTCRWDREANDYMTDGEPCRTDEYGDPTKHCTARRTCSVHIGRDELTCPRCIGRVRANLRRITPLAALMLPVAITAGVNSEAAVLAGPAANPEAWSWRKVAARQGGSWHMSLIEDDDELHPYSVLTRWQLMIAEDYGHDLPERLSIAGAADYLDRNLARIANDPEQDLPLLAAELRRCRQHLEAVVSVAARKERGAPCPECVANEDGAPRLVREYGHWCDDPDCERQFHHTTVRDPRTGEDVPDTTADRWVCPRNRDHWWSHEDYAKWIEERRKGA